MWLATRDSYLLKDKKKNIWSSCNGARLQHLIFRLITENRSFLLVFYGACSEIGHNTCLYSFFVETFGFSHGLNSILLSICYRYFSLRYGVPKRKPIIILCFVTCLPSLVPIVSHFIRNFLETSGKLNHTLSGKSSKSRFLLKSGAEK